jgi:hypothetical protein
MKALTDRQKQWAWFAGLWCAGLVSMALLAYAFRWIVRL